MTVTERETTLKPVALAERIHLLDVLRGVALLGVLSMNLPDNALPHQALRQQAFAHPGNASYWTHTIANILFDGKMRALFSLLFGASAVLFITRKEAQSGGSITVADLYFRRTFWLIVFGVVHAHFLLSPYELLYFYGVCGFLLFAVRHSSTKWLLSGVLFCALFLTTISWIDYHDTRAIREKYRIVVGKEKQHLPVNQKQKDEKLAWENIIKERKFDPKKDSVEVATMKSNYAGIWNYNHPFAVNGESSTFYMLFWDPLGMMLLGIVLLRWGVLTGRSSRRTYFLLMLCGYLFGVPLCILAEKHSLLQFQDFGKYIDQNQFSWNDNTYHIRRLCMMLGHVGLVGFLYKSNWFAWGWKALGSVGRMALTNYVAHTVICLLLFYGFGLGLFATLKLYQAYYFVAGICIFQLVTCPIWFRYFRFGPLEWVWRSLTYRAWQPMKVR